MVVADIEGVVNEVPEPSETPPVKAVYQLIVPAEEVAAKPVVPAAHIVAPVEDVMVGTAVTVTEAATVSEMAEIAAQETSPLVEPDALELNLT